jgi:hypothetical protein
VLHCPLPYTKLTILMLKNEKINASGTKTAMSGKYKYRK